MAATSILKYLGNGAWLYRSEQGAAIITAADQPALNAIVKEGGSAIAETSVHFVDGVLTVKDVHDITVTAAEGNTGQTLEDTSKIAIGVMAGLLAPSATVALVGGLGVGAILDRIPRDPYSNLEYAHEFNFEGSPYYQESNRLPVPGKTEERIAPLAVQPWRLASFSRPRPWGRMVNRGEAPLTYRPTPYKRGARQVILLRP